MNTYAWIILVTIVFSYILNLVSDLLNLSALKDNLPEEFNGIYDEESYQNSQKYTRVLTRFSFITDLFDLIVFLGFWFLGGFNYLDQYVRSFEFGPIQTGLLFIGILLFAGQIISIPFRLYRIFVIEEKFGFNKTTLKVFFTDLVKGMILGVILGGALISGILAFFTYAGPYAWAYAWAVTITFMLVIHYIAPAWIMPMFNKFTPLEEGELRDKIMSYAKSVNFPLQDLYIIDGSKRSTKANAFFTGMGKNKRIALFDTLVEKQTVPELVSVVAHEVGHFKLKHIFQGFMIGIIHTGITFYLLSIFLNHKELFDAFYMQDTSVYAGLIFFGMLFKPIEMILSIFMQLFSRKNEFEADRYAVDTAKEEPQALIGALKKLSRDNLSNLTPHPFYVFLHYSHPPVLTRIAAIRNHLPKN
ncbi:M48 family metallopeptidase [Candidatus Uabimicrobium sp. HlEnr_7]|uniref:M48 family metallopeptidase n=1 Tax=Candidatus Uabimicrobium helgolandensis TaxID=3095367 RepID=UPI003558B09D